MFFCWNTDWHAVWLKLDRQVSRWPKRTAFYESRDYTNLTQVARRYGLTMRQLII